MGFESGEVAYPPDVIADAVFVAVDGGHFLAGDLFADGHGFYHGDVALTATADVVHLGDTWVLVEVPEGLDEIVAVDVVADLLPFVSENLVLTSFDGAFHEVGEEAVELGTGVAGAGEAAAAEARRLHIEIAAVFLDHDIGGDFRCAEDGVDAVVDGHGLSDAVGVFVVGGDFPAGLLLDEGKGIGAVAVDFIGGREEEYSLGRVEARGLKHVECADSVHPEIGAGFFCGPIVAWLGGRMDDELNVFAEFVEESVDGFRVAYIGGFVSVFREIGFEFVGGPCGGRFVAEEILSHVVIDTDYFETLAR